MVYHLQAMVYHHQVEGPHCVGLFSRLYTVAYFPVVYFVINAEKAIVNIKSFFIQYLSTCTSTY
jgi:hypothetical protein